MKKIPTLFKRVFDGNRLVDILPEITKGCEEAFPHGVATLKWDGAVKCQEEPDPITGHFLCWIKCDRSKPDDKWFWSAYDKKLSLLKEKVSYVTRLPDGTYEAVGKHFQGNPYNFDFDCLVRHGTILREVERTFEGVKKFLSENYREGIVFWLDGNPVCKIKRTDFGFEWNGKGGEKNENNS